MSSVVGPGAGAAPAACNVFYLTERYMEPIRSQNNSRFGPGDDSLVRERIVS